MLYYFIYHAFRFTPFFSRKNSSENIPTLPADEATSALVFKKLKTLTLLPTFFANKQPTFTLIFAKWMAFFL